MVFQVEQLYKSFGVKKVLEGISFSATSGRALGLLGRNGAGKTTSIRIIMGVFPADSGGVLMDGKQIQRDKIKIGYLPEEHGLYPKIEIINQLVYLARLRGMKTHDAKVSINKWMKRLGLEEYTGKKLETLSKGNQQKVQLVATLITNPDFIILDEPFSGLDPVNAALLKDVVKEQIGLGKIVLFSSHQMGYVEEFCDDIAILKDGKIVLSGDIREIKRGYDRNILLIRSPKMREVMDCCKTRFTGVVDEVRQSRNGVIALLSPSAGREEFMAAILGMGLDIDAIGVHEPSLEEIFVEYTGDDGEEEAINA